MTNIHIKKYCTLSKEARALLKHASIKLDFSARTYFKVIKVAQTISDLELGSIITENNIAEAVQYK